METIQRAYGAESQASAPLLLTVEEASRALRIGRSRMYEMIGRNELPVIRIGKSVRISRKALEQFVAAREADSAA